MVGSYGPALSKSPVISGFSCFVIFLGQAKVGERVGVRVGGTFRVDDEEAGKHPLLLIAGGIGITPLYCILKHTLEVMETQDAPKGANLETH